MLKRLSLFVLVSLFAFQLPAAEPFKDGDRWLAVGDSITHGGTYHAWVYLYYATRFPAMKLEVRNGGISGDTAPGAVRRYDWDLQPWHGTVATVMLGMNDVNRGLYDQVPPTPQNLEQRAAAIQKYKDNFTILAERLKKDNLRLIFMTPSPFDDTADLATPPSKGVNDALGKCGDFVKELAPKMGATVVDLHEPLTALNHRLQAADPKATFGGPDRVHPGAPGHFAMAYYILKAQGMPSLVSELDIDAAAGKVAQARNATVSGFSAKEGELQFSSLEKALPYPVPAEVRPALEWVPFQEDFNREVLRVTGLKKESYTLFIDGERIGEFWARQLADGVNLAELNTPQARQAAEVQTLVKKWQDFSCNRDRRVALVEHSFLKDMPHPISFEDAKPKVEAEVAKFEAKVAALEKKVGPEVYLLGVLKGYFDVKPKEPETLKELGELPGKIHEAAQPKAHAYRLVPGNGSAAAVRAATPPSPERIAEVAKWLPAQPVGFCPPASDRAFWEKVAYDRKGIIQRAEAYLKMPIPELPDELYRDYEKTGQRYRYESPFFQRGSRAMDLALAECFEMKGRFIGPLRETLEAILSETSWVLPAHNGDKQALTGKATIVDLGVAVRASTVAAIYQWLGKELGPELCQRLRAEVQRRAIDPTLQQVYQNPGKPGPGFWWIKGTNNWNAVCWGGVTYAALATVEDREMRARVAAAAAAYSVYYLDSLTEDGYCSEGMGYWNYGFGHYVLLAETLAAATHGKLDLYADKVVGGAVAFPMNMQLGPRAFPSFADCGADARPSTWITYLTSRRYAFQAEKPAFSVWNENLAILDLLLNPPPVAGERQPLAALSPLRGYFPYGGVLVTRQEKLGAGLAVGMKGGHNAENHNHNDLGSYVLATDGGVVMGDLGGEKYTARTFSAHRYDSDLLNSFGHPVPVVNGVLQKTGSDARALIQTQGFSPVRDTWTLDLTSAYPVPGLTEVRRTFTFRRDGKTSFAVTDEMKAKEPLTFSTALVTFGKFEKQPDGTLLVKEGGRTVSVRIDTNGAPWTTKEDPITAESTSRRKPTRLGINLTNPATSARIHYVVTPIPASAENRCIPLASQPELKIGQPGNIRIEAEDFSAQTGGTAERLSRPGAEKQALCFWEKEGHALEWKFSVPAEARYYVALRCANGGTTEATRSLTLDGAAVAGTDPGFDFPVTSGWGYGLAEWQNFLLARNGRPFVFALAPGAHTLRLAAPSGRGLNLDWLELIPLP